MSDAETSWREDMGPMYWMWRHLNEHVRHVYIRTGTNLSGTCCRELALKQWPELPADVRRAIMDESVHAAVMETKKILEELGIW